MVYILCQRKTKLNLKVLKIMVSLLKVPSNTYFCDFTAPVIDKMVFKRRNPINSRYSVMCMIKIHRGRTGVVTPSRPPSPLRTTFPLPTPYLRCFLERFLKQSLGIVLMVTLQEILTSSRDSKHLLAGNRVQHWIFFVGRSVVGRSYADPSIT